MGAVGSGSLVKTAWPVPLAGGAPHVAVGGSQGGDEMLGLGDRERLRPGLRADLIAVAGD